MKVDGMTCNGCVSKIKTSLDKLEGVTSCEVSLEHSMATVTFDKEKISDAMLVKAIKDAGYEAKLGGLSAAGAHHHPDGCVEGKTVCPSSKKCCNAKAKSGCAEKHESKTTKAKSQKETVTDTDI
ncbi:MAG: copper ion binding protein [candidate division Zixibacteria bacterium]|nr:copper ion binding protein [candidate division Zixibacteria bacterium]